MVYLAHPKYKECYSMTAYDSIVNQTQEGLDQATSQWTRAQEQAAAFAEDARKKFRDVLPIATEAVQANFRLASGALEAQRDLTVRWLETLNSAPAKSAKV
ncbi:MAG: hypothetical protein M3O95_03650 [Candidatus Dormibacteraeota bacterium]|nr:hypothetical protein [Candidatus Dormibacteraeota bacterium]